MIVLISDPQSLQIIMSLDVAYFVMSVYRHSFEIRSNKWLLTCLLIVSFFSTGSCEYHLFVAGRAMEKDHSLPPLSPIQSPGIPCKYLSLSPSLPHSSATVPSSPPLSPYTPISFPLTHSSPSCPTLPQHFADFTSHCLGSPLPSDQDDLTCLSWLHQRRNLLPMQPLLKISSLACVEPQDHAPAPQGPSAFGKPPYSFSSLIFMAIEDSPEKQLPVKGIYEWIINTFSYYRAAPGGWRNSVRHNLSLSKSFSRINRDKSKVRTQVGQPFLCTQSDFLYFYYYSLLRYLWIDEL